MNTMKMPANKKNKLSTAVQRHPVSDVGRMVGLVVLQRLVQIGYQAVHEDLYPWQPGRRGVHRRGFQGNKLQPTILP